MFQGLPLLSHFTASVDVKRGYSTESTYSKTEPLGDNWHRFRTPVTRTGETRGQIDKISYDKHTIMPELRSTYDRRLIYQTSHEGCKAFLRNDSVAKW